MPIFAFPRQLFARPWTVLVLLLGVGLAVYLPLLGYGIVWDDRLLLSENPYVAYLDRLPRALMADYFRYTRLVNLFGCWRPAVLWAGLAIMLRRESDTCLTSPPAPGRVPPLHPWRGGIRCCFS